MNPDNYLKDSPLEQNSFETLASGNKSFKERKFNDAVSYYLKYIVSSENPSSALRESIIASIRFAKKRWYKISSHSRNHRVLPPLILNLKGSAPNALTTVQVMLEHCFGMDPSYEGYLIVLGYNTQGWSAEDLKKQYPDRKLVLFQLEQLASQDNLWLNQNHHLPMVRSRTKRIENWLKTADEIWDYDVDNIRFLESKGYKNVFHYPLRYASPLSRFSQESSKIYDILFFGALNKRRAELLALLPKNLKVGIIGDLSLITDQEIEDLGLRDKLVSTTLIFGAELQYHIRRAKFVLNLHYYEGAIQEQVRIFDLLSNNVPVISEKSTRNYFGDLVIEVDKVTLSNETETKKILSGLKANSSIRKKFEERRLRDYKVGVSYSTFYGIQLLKTSIESLRAVADYIVVVHQQKSFSGQIETQQNRRFLEDLLRHKYIDNIVDFQFGDNEYTDPTLGMIAKRNIGLDCCRNNQCDFIITADADECYHSTELERELDRLFQSGQDTLYSPIWAYYGDFHHYFVDSYYVPSVYRIMPNRSYRKVQTAVLCDPSRRMSQGAYSISKVPMHHLTYLPKDMEDKLNSKIVNSMPEKKAQYEQIVKHLQSWQPGKKALVFTNPPGKGAEVELTYVDLLKTDKVLF